MISSANEQSSDSYPEHFVLQVVFGKCPDCCLSSTARIYCDTFSTAALSVATKQYNQKYLSRRQRDGREVRLGNNGWLLQIYVAGIVCGTSRRKYENRVNLMPIDTETVRRTNKLSKVTTSRGGNVCTPGNNNNNNNN